MRLDLMGILNLYIYNECRNSELLIFYKSYISSLEIYLLPNSKNNPCIFLYMYVCKLPNSKLKDGNSLLRETHSSGMP